MRNIFGFGSKSNSIDEQVELNEQDLELVNGACHDRDYNDCDYDDDDYCDYCHCHRHHCHCHHHHHHRHHC